MEKQKQQAQKTPNKEGMVDRLMFASIQGAMVGLALNALMPVAGQAVTSGIVKKMGKSVASESVKVLTEDKKHQSENDANEKLALDILTHGLGR